MFCVLDLDGNCTVIRVHSSLLRATFLEKTVTLIDIYFSLLSIGFKQWICYDGGHTGWDLIA